VSAVGVTRLLSDQGIACLLLMISLKVYIMQRAALIVISAVDPGLPPGCSFQRFASLRIISLSTIDLTIFLSL